MKRYPTRQGLDLFEDLRELLLRGWMSPTWPKESADPFRIFEMRDADLRQAWRTHRNTLMAEWCERGLLEQPWAIEQGFEQ